MDQDSRYHIGVIFGGRSGEHEVSLMSAQSILNAFDPARYRVTQIGIAQDGSWWTGENVLDVFSSHRSTGELIPAAIFPDPSRPGLCEIEATANGEGSRIRTLKALDVIFPVLHGTFGEDGTLQGLLELADLAYVGAGVTGSAVGMDKALFKDLMRANDIPVVETLVVLRSQVENDLENLLDRAEETAAYPLFVKPANLGSSVGITKCLNRSDLFEGLHEAARYDRKIIIERGLDAREIEISVLGNDLPQVSIPGEIIPSREFYSYESKYLDESSRLLIPAPLSPNLTKRVQDLALRAYRAADCAGMARVDFLLEREPGKHGDPDGLYLSEINTIPGFTKISMYPKLWEASGISYPALVDRLIELALERKRDRDRTERRYQQEK